MLIDLDEAGHGPFFHHKDDSEDCRRPTFSHTAVLPRDGALGCCVRPWPALAVITPVIPLIQGRLAVQRICKLWAPAN
jgi:hypothetical protein